MLGEHKTMSKKTAGRGRSPRLADYIKAAMRNVRLLAKIEKTADLPPGSLINEMMDGVVAGHEVPGKDCPAFAWADSIARASGKPWTGAAVEALARKLKPIVRAA